MGQCNVQIGPLRLELEWRLTLFTLVLIPFLFSLGLWQLDRAEEKAVIAAEFAERSVQPRVPLGELQPLSAERSSLAYRPVTVTGTVEPNHYLLLDNKIHGGRVGFEVIVPMRTPEFIVPVNFGWVPGDPSRRTLPTPVLPTGTITVMGTVYVPLDDAYVLATEEAPPSLPAVVQSFVPERDLVSISSALATTPVTVRIAETDPHAFVVDWPIVNVSPEKHTGYAVQWFTMSAVLLLIFSWRSSNLSTLLRRPPPPSE
jgi:cytochrome oxidase assembly protein ShyY1